jgi:putative peptidoglycan lipid II flippase
MKKAINIMICMMLPITIVTCLCASNIVSIIYERGKFDGASVAMTSAALIGYALGFASMGVRDIILRGLYSFKNMKGPMITGIIAVAVNILFSVILSRFLGIMGITIASSISMTVNFIINSQMLKKHLPSYNFLAHIPVLLKQIPSIAFSLVVIIFIKEHVTNNILVFLLSAVIGIAGYGLILLFMKIEEVDYIKAKVLAKLPTRK